MPQTKRRTDTRGCKRRVKTKPEPYRIEKGVTQSLLGTWVNCRQAARYYLDGWRREETKETLAFGSLWHHLLEGLHDAIMHGDMTLEYVDDYCMSAVKSFRKRAAGWTSPVEAQTMELVIAKAMALFSMYCRRYAADFDATLWHEVESVFDVNWRGFRLRGRVDGIRRISKQRKLAWVLETKTMEQIGKALEDMLTFDFQSLFYVTAASQRMKRRAAGVIYNVVRRPAHKPKSGEPLPAYTLRLQALVEKDPEHFFKRFEVQFAPDDRRRFEDELEAKLRAFRAWVGACDDPDKYAPTCWTWRNERACRGRGTCDWLDACSSGDMVGYEPGGRLFEELE